MLEPAPSPPSAPNGNSSSAGTLIPALWFDGLTSHGRPVLLELRASPEGPCLLLHPLDRSGVAAETVKHRDIQWPEAWSAHRPPPQLVVDLRDRGSVVITQTADWSAALDAAGYRPGWAQRMQTRWGTLLIVLCLALVFMAAFYRYGTPWLAGQVVRYVPLTWETRLSAQAMNALDERLLEPSKLGLQRQQALRADFEALVQDLPLPAQRYAGYTPQYQLLFRSGIEANAFALPGGVIVMSDALVMLAHEKQLPDAALLGVLAHETGHVAHRHGTRMVVEQGILNFGLELALGDVSGLLSSTSTLLTGLAYRRGHEGEADCFALMLMQAHQLPTRPMADLLLALDRQNASEPESPPQISEDSSSWRWSGLLNSHPEAALRAQALRDGHAPHCAKP